MPIFAGADTSRSHADVTYADGIAAVRAACEARGRDPAEMTFSIFGVPPKESVVAGLLEIGFDRVIFGLPAADADTVLPIMDRCADLAGRLSA